MKRILLLLVVLTMLSGCSDSGKNFIGKWEGEANPKTIEITLDGKNYIVKGFKSFWDSKPVDVIATFKNGSLVVDSNDFAFTITYNKADNTITLGDNAVYNKVK